MNQGNEGHTSALYVWNGICMFWGTSFHTDPHSHNTLQLVFDIDKKLKLKDAANDWAPYSAALIGAGHVHQLDSCGSIQLFIYLDADSHYARKLTDKYLKDQGIADLADTGIADLSTGFFKKLLVQSDCKVLFEGCQTLLEHLVDMEKPSVIDERILKAVDFIASAQNRQFKVAEVADHVCLSESRLRHLFKAQVGQPIQSFIKWMKVVDSLNLVLNGRQLAQSAIDAGFWDSSHMNKSYRELLGIAPGQVRAFEKDLKIVACSGDGLQKIRTEIYQGLNTRSTRKIIEI